MMGVSDVLFEAHEDINDHLVSFPDRYEFVRERLEKLLAEMDAVRKILDTPPSHDERSADELAKPLLDPDLPKYRHLAGRTD